MVIKAMSEEKILKINSTSLGATVLDTYREVTWRDTMNYAAATEDYNPLYYDDSGSTEVIAPPMYAVAFTWPILDEERGNYPAEISLRGVHAIEHIIFHQLVKAGQQLRMELKAVSIKQTRAGVLKTSRITVFDDNGDKVFTEYSSGLLRGVVCEDGGGESEPVPEIPEFEGESGTIWTVEIPVAKGLAHVYDGCTRIINPIHTSKSVAESVGLPNIILQGTCTLALAARELINREAAGAPERLMELSCQFRNMVIPGTTIQLKLNHRQPETNGSTALGFEVVNDRGEVALAKGFARVK